MSGQDALDTITTLSHVPASAVSSHLIVARASERFSCRHPGRGDLWSRSLMSRFGSSAGSFFGQAF